MVIIPLEKPELEPLPCNGAGVDRPPAYDAISLQNGQSTSNTMTSSECTAGSSSPNLVPLRTSSLQSCNSGSRATLNLRASGELHAISQERRQTRLRKPRQRPNSSWLSFLPFTSSRSAKQARQTILATINDLIVSPYRLTSTSSPDAHEILSSCANLCAEHRLSLSDILQEPSVADHTPMYWAIVNYHEALLVALLTFAGQLGPAAVSDIRRACLVSSNQSLFHALRVKRPPFRGVHGLKVPSLHAASDSLLLGSLPPDKVQVLESALDGAFTVQFDVVLWQRRMRAAGRVSVEFIASGRLWCITFFSTDAPTLNGTKARSRSGGTWHVMLTFLESGPPTHLDAQLLIEAPPPSARPPTLIWHTPHPSQNYTSSDLDTSEHTPSAMSDSNHDGMAHHAPLSGNSSTHSIKHHIDKDYGMSLVPGPSSSLPPPVHPRRAALEAKGQVSSFGSMLRGKTPPIVIRLRAQTHKLARRGKPGVDPTDANNSLSIKPECWYDNGGSYTSAVIAPLGEGIGSQLMFEKSRYLFSDGTLTARLEARLVKSEFTKDCVIC